MSRKGEIIEVLRVNGAISASAIHHALTRAGDTASLVTIRRDLKRLVDDGILGLRGAGRSVVYLLTTFGKITDDVDARAYCATDPDKRYGAKSFDFELLPACNFSLFSEKDAKILAEATSYYCEKSRNVSDILHKKELERFVIELSWKSSRIEGNTYTLLDTEKLLMEAKEAPGHDHKEARMILNHKIAFDYVRANAKQFINLTRGQIEDVHRLLVADLGVTHNIRKKPVGVMGSIYRPLDNEFQINDAIDTLIQTVNTLPDGYMKALVALLGISYIQPFEDGNKRAARLITNALLLAHGLAPLSYRSVSEEDYREATLVFYELNSIVPFRKIFVSQYDFSARNYLAVS